MSEYINQIGRLSKRLAAAKDRIASQKLVLDDLREENYRLERILQTPLSLKDLQVAYEAAEVPTDDNPIREGDALISNVIGGHLIRPAVAAEDGWVPFDSCRILSRAPRPREPWQGLADDLADRSTLMGDIETAAKALHEAGWRKGGDDE